MLEIKPIDPLSVFTPKDPVIDAITETLKECGYRGEDITMEIVHVLKRLGRYDLLPPCERE